MVHRNSSLIRRLNWLLAVCFVPFAIVTVYLIGMAYQFSGQYDRIVDKITRANAYNIDFKEDIDYTMYVIVVNSERASEIVNPERPYELIDSARETFRTLSAAAEEEEARSQLTGIVKCLNTLEDRVTEMEQDAQVTGMYDRNLERLDLDIRILTELIQEKIQEYIYYETTRLQELRGAVSEDVSRALFISVSISLVTLAGALLLSRKISKSLTMGIRQLLTVTRKVGQGDFSVRADLRENDSEMQELEVGFNHMVEHIGELVEDIREEQKNQRLTEQKLLQAQINPHFLYNTLDAIIWQAEAGETESVIMMVTALSDFFRTTLSKGRDYITVEEEQSHICSYLQIQQFRYQDILDYEIAISKELYPYQILKLTLQPLVENALYHGIKNKRGRGHICVTGELTDGMMVFVVRDNGMGMTPERLEQVRREMNKGQEVDLAPSVFGLFNVVERIRLNYGSEYGMELNSTYGEGTEAIIRIPAIKN